MKTEDPALYHAVENNTLLNDVFFYILHLPQLQNMHETWCLPRTRILTVLKGILWTFPQAKPFTPKASPCLRIKRTRNLLPLPPLELLPLPPLPRAVAMARDRLPLVGRLMPE